MYIPYCHKHNSVVYPCPECIQHRKQNTIGSTTSEPPTSELNHWVFIESQDGRFCIDLDKVVSFWLETIDKDKHYVRVLHCNGTCVILPFGPNTEKAEAAFNLLRYKKMNFGS